MLRLFFRLVVLWERLRGQDWHINRAEWKAYRQARGGRWGLWESNAFGDKPLRCWWPSNCEHYPPPPLVNSTEPLASEVWGAATNGNGHT